uniref:Probable glycerol kinase n=1 Tax=Artemia sinica TaxID=112780 RepID=L0L3N1_9CRUS|nr:glycerol kinase [Artemia sinica]
MGDALIGAIDQGTSSSRFLVFAAKNAELITFHQIPIHKKTPKEDWVEFDPEELLHTALECMEKTMYHLQEMGYDPANVKSVGISNQRETTIVWDKFTGKPLYNAIVWCDNRTVSTVDSLLAKVPGKDINCLKGYCGLPVAPYFSAVKLSWLLQNVPEVRIAVDEERCLFGTVDTWLLWNLTGGRNGGLHLTDVTNASRTALMNIETLEWDPYLLRFFGVPKSILPEIRSSSEIYGYITLSHRLKGVPISSMLGDQQAALLGQMCVKRGQAKCTYGTGCFLLCNSGNKPIFSDKGLITTIGYQLGKTKRPVYAIEGSVAVAGSSIRWLQKNMGIIKSEHEIESLAASVTDSGGVYFVPAFSGLYAPHWRTDARGTICGLTHYSTSAHIARATLEAVCYQTRDVLLAINSDCGQEPTCLQVDGGMAANNLLLQMQADILGIPVIRPSMCETSALGAATAAGLAEGINVWQLDVENSANLVTETFQPSILEEDRARRYNKWHEAIKRSLGWVPSIDTPVSKPDSGRQLLSSLPGSWYIVSSLALWMISMVAASQ